MKYDKPGYCLKAETSVNRWCLVKNRRELMYHRFKSIMENKNKYVSQKWGVTLPSTCDETRRLSVGWKVKSDQSLPRNLMSGGASRSFFSFDFLSAAISGSSSSSPLSTFSSSLASSSSSASLSASLSSSESLSSSKSLSSESSPPTYKNN